MIILNFLLWEMYFFYKQPVFIPTSKQSIFFITPKWIIKMFLTLAFFVIAFFAIAFIMMAFFCNSVYYDCVFCNSVYYDGGFCNGVAFIKFAFFVMAFIMTAFLARRRRRRWSCRTGESKTANGAEKTTNGWYEE